MTSGCVACGDRGQELDTQVSWRSGRIGVDGHDRQLGPGPLFEQVDHALIGRDMGVVLETPQDAGLARQVRQRGRRLVGRMRAARDGLALVLLPPATRSPRPLPWRSHPPRPGTCAAKDRRAPCPKGRLEPFRQLLHPRLRQSQMPGERGRGAECPARPAGCQDMILDVVTTAAGLVRAHVRPAAPVNRHGGASSGRCEAEAQECNSPSEACSQASGPSASNRSNSDVSAPSRRMTSPASIRSAPSRSWLWSRASHVTR